MSVIIKGMEMPRGCNVCQLRDLCFDYYICRAKKLDDGRYLDVDDVVDRRHRYCPLVEIPTPHGRLIDADYINGSGLIEWQKSIVKAEISQAPTVVEAEVSE